MLLPTIGAAAVCAAACMPSVSTATPILPPPPPPMMAIPPAAIQPQPALLVPLQQRAKIVPRFRFPAANKSPLLAPPPLPDEYHTHRVYNGGAVAAKSPLGSTNDVGSGGMPLQSTNNGPASTLVSRILQVALGLFVTTMELPPLPPKRISNQALGYDCDFSNTCRWSSVGATPERWRLARGEPDVLLWLAATGTMLLPVEPFTLIEVRGGTPVDMLSSDIIDCQREPALFGFTYWTVGLSDLEICLLDLQYRQFNCTGMLQSHIQPGKVALKIPPVNHPFRIAIIPSVDQGILVLDDIKYDAKYCGDSPPVIEPLPLVYSTQESPTIGARSTPISFGLSGPTAFPFIPNPVTVATATATMTTTTLAAPILLPLTFTPVVPPYISSTFSPPLPSTRLTPIPNIFTPSPESSIPLISLPTPSAIVPIGGVKPTSFPQTAPTLATEFPYVTPKPILIVPEPMEPFITTTTSPPPPLSTLDPLSSQSGASAPFDLLIFGNRTAPFFDRRRGEIVKESGDLLCDFANSFPCQWGPSAGKWAVIEKGAIPSLEFGSKTELPTYPALVVIQSAAVLTSDPMRCQSGEGKLLFRYWANGRVLLQVCAIGYKLDSEKTQCAEEVTRTDEHHFSKQTGGDSGMNSPTLAVFTLSNVMREPFTLNIIPIFERNSRNNYLVLDEIAYIGECNLTALAEREEKMTRGGVFGLGTRNMATPKSDGNNDGGSNLEIYEDRSGDVSGDRSGGTSPETPKPRVKPTLRIISMQTTTPWPHRSIFPVKQSTTDEPEEELMRTLIPTSRKAVKGTRYPFLPTTPYIISSTTMRAQTIPGKPTTIVYPKPGRPDTATTKRKSFTIPYSTTSNVTVDESYVDYCKLLNCDFNENACNYLNHGMTKIPWTLKNKNYGFPLSKNVDIRPTSSNGHFLSALLGTGDFAILESPRFNLTHGINVLLFQYYRPTHSLAIRLCLGTRYTKPYRTVASFLQCPPILRSMTSKNAMKWNSVHIQLPPGTSQFFLVAQNMNRIPEKSAIAIDNIRVAICDPHNYSPPRRLDLNALESEINGSNEEDEKENNEEASSVVDETESLAYRNDN